MKSIATFLTLLAMMIVISPSRSRADVCLTEFNGPNLHLTSDETTSFGDDDVRLYRAAVSCQKLDAWKFGIHTVAYTYSVASAALLCSGIGAEVGVLMSGLNGVTATASFIVDHLPCDDTRQKDQVDQLVREKVCLALEQSGVTCDPQRLRRK